MKTVTLSGEAVRHSLSEWRHHPLIKDPISVAALCVSVGLVIITFIILLIRVHAVGYKVGVHYMNLVGFDRLGSWYEVYRFPLVAGLMVLINSLLAAKSFQRNRLVSFFLLLGSVVVGLLSLVISLAFAVVV